MSDEPMTPQPADELDRVMVRAGLPERGALVTALRATEIAWDESGHPAIATAGRTLLRADWAERLVDVVTGATTA